MKTRKRFIGGKLTYSDAQQKWLPDPSGYDHVATYRAAEAKILNLLSVGKTHDVWKLFVSNHSTLTSLFAKDEDIQFIIIKLLNTSIEQRKIGLSDMKPGSVEYIRHENMIKGEESLLKKLEPILETTLEKKRKQEESYLAIITECKKNITKFGKDRLSREISTVQNKLDRNCTSGQKDKITSTLQSNRDKKLKAEQELSVLTNRLPPKEEELELVKEPPKLKEPEKSKASEMPKPKASEMPKPKVRDDDYTDGAPKPSVLAKLKQLEDEAIDAAIASAAKAKVLEEKLPAKVPAKIPAKAPAKIPAKAPAKAPENVSKPTLDDIARRMYETALSSGEKEPIELVRLLGFLRKNSSKFTEPLYGDYYRAMYSKAITYSIQNATGSYLDFIDDLNADYKRVKENSLTTKTDIGKKVYKLTRPTENIVARARNINELLKLNINTTLPESTSVINAHYYAFLNDLTSSDPALCDNDDIYICIQTLYTLISIDSFSIKFLSKYAECKSPRIKDIVRSFCERYMRTLPGELESQMQDLLNSVDIDNKVRLEYIRLTQLITQQVDAMDPQHPDIDNIIDLFTQLDRLLDDPDANAQMKIDYMDKVVNFLSRLQPVSLDQKKLIEFLKPVYKKYKFSAIKDIIDDYYNKLDGSLGLHEASTVMPSPHEASTVMPSPHEAPHEAPAVEAPAVDEPAPHEELGGGTLKNKNKKKKSRKIKRIYNSR